MAWLMLLGALACFAMAILLPVGSAMVLLLLLTALALFVFGATRFLSDRLNSVIRPPSGMLDAAEMARIREHIAARQTEPSEKDDERA